MKRFSAAGLLALGAVAAHAEGCPPEGGIEIAKVEAMNQLLLDKDFEALTKAINDEIGAGIEKPMAAIASLFSEGFDGCSTIAQRTDLGGMVQNVVIFRGKPGPLFAYWLSIPQADGYRILSFTINTSIGEVLSELR